MKAYKKALNELGITSGNNVPLKVLLSGNYIKGAYEIAEEDIAKLKALHDIIVEYNKELSTAPKQVRSSLDAVEALRPVMNLTEYEELWVIYLNNANRIIDKQMITRGSIDSTVCDNRRIMAQALSCNATSIIMAHNHPSGNPEPSMNDIKMTESLKKSGDALGIKLLDHVIVCRDCHYTFADEKTVKA